MRSILQYARRHHIAMLALFIALGGTSYAAVQIPRNSIGTAQVRDESIRSNDVRDGSLLPREFRSGTLARSLRRDGALDGSGGTGPAGPQGPAGPAGPSRLNEQLPAARAIFGSGATQTIPDGAASGPPSGGPNPRIPRFPTEQYDIGGLFDPSNPTELVIPRTGTYVVTALVRWDPNATGYRTLNIHGPQPGGVRASSTMPAVNGDLTRQGLATTERFEAGDRLFLSLSQTSGGDLAIRGSQNQQHFSAAFVGP